MTLFIQELEYEIKKNIIFMIKYCLEYHIMLNAHIIKKNICMIW